MSMLFFFFFSSRRRHTRCSRDWSSDVCSSDLFRREGLDVVGVVPINVAQALLGSKIKVRTLDGKRVVLKVPPGTQHGQKFRIPGQGIERNGRRGDQYVEIHVQIPEKLTPEQEAAVREFAEKSGMKH